MISALISLAQGSRATAAKGASGFGFGAGFFRNKDQIFGSAVAADSDMGCE